MKVNEIKEGVKIGSLTAIRPWGCGKRGNKRWLFKCDCGNYKPLQISRLTQKSSCGCRITNKSYGDSASNSKYRRLYFCWHDMKNRCYNKNNKKYHRYGKRGIKVYDKWRNDYSIFRKWSLDNGWDYNLSQQEQSLDRIDVDGDCCPENCRWVDMKTQGRNKRNTVYILFNNEYTPLIEVAEKVNIPYKTLHKRYISGVRGDNLIAPIDKFVQKLKKYSIGDKMMTVREISQKYNISEPAVRQKIFKNTLNELERNERK